jgi:hypothetical protein
MEQIISKEELETLLKIKGETRGLGMRDEIDFIRGREGEEAVKKLEEVMKNLGYPIRYKEIKPMDFFPLNKYAIVQLAMKRLFNFKDRDFEIMGRYESKVSLVMRLFMKYFFSAEQVIKQAPNIWRRYYTVGELKIIEFNKEKKYVIMRLENFHLHKLNCYVLKGYFVGILQMVIGGKDITCEETKCLCEGDEYDEFLLKW